jgi:hypothetical protein
MLYVLLLEQMNIKMWVKITGIPCSVVLSLIALCGYRLSHKFKVCASNAKSKSAGTSFQHVLTSCLWVTFW